MKEKSSSGRAFIVRSGPGDPRLLTVRAAELIRTADRARTVRRYGNEPDIVAANVTIQALHDAVVARS